MKAEEKEKKGITRDRRPRARQVWKIWKMAVSFLLLVKIWLCVNAAAEGLQKRTEMMERLQQQKVQVQERRWAEEIRDSQKEKTELK